MEGPAMALRCGVLAAGALGIVSGAPISAQPTNNDEIVVTATRESRALQDVPIAVQAFSNEDLIKRQVTSTTDLSTIAPGLSVQPSGGTRSNLTVSIRGQGQEFGQIAPGVVNYLADVPDFPLSFYDVRDIEVLKGPQGTLFGRNTTGGAVLVSPAKPGNDWQGYFLARLGDHDRRDAEFGVGGALIPDKIKLRLAGQALHRGGYTRDISTDQWVDNENRQSLRGSLVISPTERLENYTIVQYDRVRERTGSGQIIQYIPSPTNGGLATYLPLQSPRRTYATAPLQYFFNSLGVINTTSYDLSDYWQVKNIFSYRKFKTQNGVDNDSSPLPLLETVNPFHDVTELTEEFQANGRIGRLKGTAGIYYQRNSDPLHLAILSNQVGIVHQSTYSSSKSNSVAGYVQLDYEATDALTLTGGVRRTHDHVEGRSQATTTLLSLPLPTGLVAPFPPNKEASFTATTWNLAATYQVTSGINLYATVRRGYKQGGFNTTAPSSEFEAFQPEFVTDHEVGIKTRFRSGELTLRANVDLFYEKFKNIQRSVILATVPTSTVTTNAASADIYGLDLDFSARYTKYFDLSIAYSYLHPRYNEYISPIQGDLSKSFFTNAPEHQLTVTPAVHVPLSERAGTITALASIYYQSLSYINSPNVPNGNPTVDLSAKSAKISPYSKVDLKVSWDDIYRSGIGIAVFARNLTNKLYRNGAVSVISVPYLGFSEAFNAPPRTIGVELRYNFGK